MFKEMLLATTALLAVAMITSSEARTGIESSTGPMNTALFANARDGHLMQTMASAIAIAGEDKNTQFLCTYGGYDVNRYYSSSDYFKGSSWKHVAVPIRGHGRTVDTLVVRNGARHFDNSRRFSAGIYSSSPSGTPGALIAAGTSRTNVHCKGRKVDIPQTFLKDGKKYWVVETVPLPEYRGGNSVIWATDPVARDDAYSQYHKQYVSGLSGSHHYSYTSPWTRISGHAPFVRVK